MSQRRRRRTSLPWRARRSTSTSARPASRRSSPVRSAYRAAAAGKALPEVCLHKPHLPVSTAVSHSFTTSLEGTALQDLDLGAGCRAAS